MGKNSNGKEEGDRKRQPTRKRIKEHGKRQRQGKEKRDKKRRERRRRKKKEKGKIANRKRGTGRKAAQRLTVARSTSRIWRCTDGIRRTGDGRQNECQAKQKINAGRCGKDRRRGAERGLGKVKASRAKRGLWKERKKGRRDREMQYRKICQGEQKHYTKGRATPRGEGTHPEISISSCSMDFYTSTLVHLQCGANSDTMSWKSSFLAAFL